MNGKAQNASGDYTEFNTYTGEMEKNFSATRWLQALSEDWAARNDWTVSSYDQCNHPPVVSTKEYDIPGAAGDMVSLSGNAEDLDGDSLKITWWVYKEASEYSGKNSELTVSDASTLNTSFVIPAVAKSCDYFNIILEVKDDASAPMTRYA